MKFKLLKTDLFLNGKLISEGSTIELTEKEASTLSVYLEELKEEHPKKDETNSQENSNSEKTETKPKRGKQ